MTLQAVVAARHGTLPAGAADVTAECDGRLLVASDGPIAERTLVDELGGIATEVEVVELDAFEGAAWAAALTPLIGADVVIVLPASADGRDLAPHLSHARRCPLHANAVRVTPERVEVVCDGGQAIRTHATAGACVVTLQPGVRSAGRPRPPFALTAIEPPAIEPPDGVEPSSGSVTSLELLDADAATVDLAEAPRIVAGGAGLDSPERFDQLAAVAAALDASVGTTRVVTDRGWLPHQRQIGTTGVVVDPELYVAFGISGAVQHTSGIGSPKHVVSVNTDPHCPMAHRADVALVSDANAVIEHLAALLVPEPSSARRTTTDSVLSRHTEAEVR